MYRSSRAQSGKLRWRCATKKNGVETLCYQTTDPSKPVRGKQNIERMPEFKAPIVSTRIVLTWAQNATPVHKGFWAALKAYAKAQSAQLMVMPGRYRNPTSMWTANDESQLWWADEVKPYLCNQRKKLHPHLIFLADVNTQPTAVRPLSGFEGLTHAESGVLGHPKLQLECVPTPQQRLPKVLTTTGAVTVPNYTDSKAGKKGGFHHVHGAVVVELDGSSFHLRHLNARSDGAFIDLDRAYYPDGSVKPAGPYEAVVFGDTHVRFIDKALEQATFGPKGLVERLNPKALVFHDLLDSYAVNPHHQLKPFIAVAKRRAAYDDVHSEVLEACDWLANHAGKRQAYVVSSNHNDFLARWLDRSDWRLDPENAEFYLETALHLVRSAKMSKSGAVIADPFKFWGERLLKGASNIRFLGRSESLNIAGVECSLHGDQGPNGARGNRTNLSKIGAKTIVGHSHTPGITEGCYQTGTSTPLQLEYTGSVGSWLNCHASLDNMGKRHLHIFVSGGFWR